MEIKQFVKKNLIEVKNMKKFGHSPKTIHNKCVCIIYIQYQIVVRKMKRCGIEKISYLNYVY